MVKNSGSESECLGSIPYSTTFQLHEFEQVISCYGLSCIPQNLYVEVLTLSTSEGSYI